MRRFEALYELCELRPFTISESSNEARLSGSCGLDKVTLRDRDSVRVSPDGVRIVVLDV